MEDIEEFLINQRNALEMEKARFSKIAVNHSPSPSPPPQSPSNSIHSIQYDDDNNNNNSKSNIEHLTIPDTISLFESSTPKSESSKQCALNYSENPKSNPFQLYDTLIQQENRSKPRQDNENTLQKNNKQQKLNEMDSWVTDTFYDYFPSFGAQKNVKQKLNHDRKEEYKNYLKQLKEFESNVAKVHRNTENDYYEYPNIHEQNATNEIESTEIQRDNSKINNSRSKLLKDLQHTDLPHIFHSNAIQERNQQMTQDQAQRKMEYRDELIKQIEEKKREVEALRAKEQAEDDRVTRKLEAQLESIKLQEEKIKQNTHANNRSFNLYAIEPSPPAPLRRSVRQITPNSSQQQQQQQLQHRNARSEDGNPKMIEPKVYYHFSNSAPINGPEYYGQSNRNDRLYCQRCQEHLKENLCEHCDRKRHSFHNGVTRDGGDGKCIRCYNRLYTGAERRNGECTECRKVNRNCSFCRQHDNICPECNALYCLRCRHRKPVVDQLLIEENNDFDDDVDENVSFRSNRNHHHRHGHGHEHEHTKSIKSLELNYSEQIERDLDISPIVIRDDRKPYSMNIQKKSIFTQNPIQPITALNIKNGKISITDDIDEVRRKTNEKIEKYAQNYGELRTKSRRKTMPTNNNSNDESPVDDSFPIPILKYHGKGTKRLSDTKQQQQQQQTDAVQTLESKIPAVQKHTIKTQPIRVFTQLGAIREQLQMEQLQFD